MSLLKHFRAIFSQKPSKSSQMPRSSSEAISRSNSISKSASSSASSTNGHKVRHKQYSHKRSRRTYKEHYISVYLINGQPALSPNIGCCNLFKRNHYLRFFYNAHADTPAIAVTDSDKQDVRAFYFQEKKSPRGNIFYRPNHQAAECLGKQYKLSKGQKEDGNSPLPLDLKHHNYHFYADESIDVNGHRVVIIPLDKSHAKVFNAHRA